MFSKTLSIACIVGTPQRSGTRYRNWRPTCRIYSFCHGRSMDEFNTNVSKLHFNLSLLHVINTQFQGSLFCQETCHFESRWNMNDIRCWSNSEAWGWTVLRSIIGTQYRTSPVSLTEIDSCIAIHFPLFSRAQSWPTYVFDLFSLSNNSSTFMSHEFRQPCPLFALNVACLAYFLRRPGTQRRRHIESEILGNLVPRSFL